MIRYNYEVQYFECAYCEIIINVLFNDAMNRLMKAYSAITPEEVIFGFNMSDPEFDIYSIPTYGMNEIIRMLKREKKDKEGGIVFNGNGEPIQIPLMNFKTAIHHIKKHLILEGFIKDPVAKQKLNIEKVVRKNLLRKKERASKKDKEDFLKELHEALFWKNKQSTLMLDLHKVIKTLKIYYSKTSTS